MVFEAAKCPSCGGFLQLDSTMEKADCVHCGRKIIVRDAIQRMKIEVSGNVSMSGISTVENDVQVGQLFLANKEWVKAYEVFCKAIEKKIDCYDAWTGCVASMTRNFTWADYGWAKLDGSKGILSAISNCYKVGSQKQNRTLTADLESLMQSIKTIEDETYKRNYSDSLRRRSGWRIVLIVLGAAYLSAAFQAIFEEIKNPEFSFIIVQIILGGLGYLIGVLLLTRKPRKLNKFRDFNALKYSEQIFSAIQQKTDNSDNVT